MRYRLPPFAAAVYLFLASGLLTLNTSPSIPTGLYVRDFVTGISAGDAVRFDGRPFGRRGYLIKYAAALPGDAITVSARGYFAAGRFWGPIPAAADPGSVHRFEGRVPRDTVFVAGSHPLSYDSRYFGGLELASVKKYRPVLVLEGGTRSARDAAPKTAPEAASGTRAGSRGRIRHPPVL